MDREEIIEKITPVAVKMGLDLKNIWVTFIINMSAEVIFLWQSISTWKVLEASLMHCTQLNSTLQHVSDLMYCTERGHLPTVKIENAIPLYAMDIKKYDLCAEIGGIKYYYNDDLPIRDADGVTSYSFELIASEETLKEVQFSTNRMYWDLTTPCTMDISLSLNGKELPVGKHLRDMSSDRSYIQTTIPNYWLRLINNNLFLGQDTYTLKYFPYPESDFTSSISISSLPQFKSITVASIKKFEPRNEDISNIKLGGISESKSNFLMATRSDIDNFVLTSPYLQGIANLNINLTSDSITIYYIMDDVSAEISLENQAAFVDSINRAYYITQRFVFTKAEPVNCNMKLKAYYTEKFNEIIVKNKISEISKRIGVTLIYDDLIAEIIRLVPEIKLIELEQPVGEKCKNLNSNQRINSTEAEPNIYEAFEEGKISC